MAQDWFSQFDKKDDQGDWFAQFDKPKEPEKPKPEPPASPNPFRQAVIGANPMELQQRILGMGKEAANAGAGVLQWVRSLAGMSPQTYQQGGVRSAVPFSPSNPEQAIGGEVAKQIPYAMAPESLPAQAAIGATAGGLSSPEHPVIGALAGGTLPIAVRGILNKALTPTSPATAIEQAIRPSSNELKASTLKAAPQIAERFPELVPLKGAQFDKALHQTFNASKLAIDAAEKALPPGTTVPQQQITDGLETLIQKFDDLDEPEAVRALTKQWEKFANQPGGIPYEKYKQLKVALGDAIDLAGGWKNTGNSPDRVKNVALRQAYRTVVDAANSVASPALRSANKDYSLLIRGMENAGLDQATGRRIAEVGKAGGQIPTGTILRYLAKKGLEGTALYTGYRVFKDYQKLP